MPKTPAQKARHKRNKKKRRGRRHAERVEAARAARVTVWFPPAPVLTEEEKLIDYEIAEVQRELLRTVTHEDHD